MSGMIGYAKPLRAIGQALETLNLTSFELEPVGEDFYVKGILAAAPELSADHLSAEKLNAVWGKLPETESVNRDLDETKVATVLTPIELQYTMKDVDRLGGLVNLLQNVLGPGLLVAEVHDGARVGCADLKRDGAVADWRAQGASTTRK